jgi:hypothetical protein
VVSGKEKAAPSGARPSLRSDRPLSPVVVMPAVPNDRVGSAVIGVCRSHDATVGSGELTMDPRRRGAASLDNVELGPQHEKPRWVRPTLRRESFREFAPNNPSDVCGH